MSKLLVLVLVVLCFVFSASATRPRQNELGAAARAVLGADARAFMRFMRVHHKVYSAEELPVRLSLYAESQRFVTEHNARFAAGLESYEVEMNRFADWTPAEWDAFLTAPRTTRPPCPLPTRPARSACPSQRCPRSWTGDAGAGVGREGPEAVRLVLDVLRHGVDGELVGVQARGQGHGEPQRAGVRGLPGQGQGPGGGWPTWVFAYAIANGGAQDEADYPYLGTDGHACKDNKSEAVAQFTSWVNITSGDEMELMSAAATTPGVSVCIDASQHGFSLYKSGVYRDATCKKMKNQLDHAVLVTGYGTDNSTGLDYYLVKNSWGPKWSDAALSTPPHSVC